MNEQEINKINEIAHLMGELTSRLLALTEQVEPEPEGIGSGYIWISPEEILRLPMDSPAWENVLAAANTAVDMPNLLDQNSKDDTTTLAKAYAYIATGEGRYADEVWGIIYRLMATDLTPKDVNILAVSRNIVGYVIAADLCAVGVYGQFYMIEIFKHWLDTLRHTVFTQGNNHSILSGHETRPNNIGLHCGSARIAIARYLGDTTDLERAATVFRGWLGDREAYTGFDYGDLEWQADPDNPVGVNPEGATLVIDGKLRNVDGVMPDDQRRDTNISWPPEKEGYVWEAMQGVVVTSEMLSRAGIKNGDGLKAWKWEDEAIWRAFEWLWAVCKYPPEGDDKWITWIVNRAYDTDYPTKTPVSPGKAMGWTDWTHAPGLG